MLVFALRPLGGLAHPVSLVIDLFHFCLHSILLVFAVLHRSMDPVFTPLQGFEVNRVLHGSLEFFMSCFIVVRFLLDQCLCLHSCRHKH